MSAQPNILQDNEDVDSGLRELLVTGYIGWFKAGAKGMGAVALKDIKAGMAIDRNPVVVMPSEQMICKTGESIEVDDYVFRWGSEKDRKSALCALPVGGYIVMCNHSPSPNAAIRQDHMNRMLELTAKRDIRKGEEITIDYDVELWFEARE
jgi:SET domain-containing protein